MTASVTKRKPTKAGQRVWFRCERCGAYGDCSGDLAATEWAASCFVLLHEHDDEGAA